MTATTVVVQAGFHRRRNCPVLATLPAAATEGAVALRDDRGRLTPCQVEPAAEPGQVQLAWLLDDLPAGEARRYTVVTAGDSSAPSASAAVTLTDRNGTHLDIAVAGDRFTSYHYAEVPARPYFHPVVGPGGALVTRGFPMEPDVPGETNDHPHHRGLYFAHGDVNDTNNWSEVAGHATMRHQGFERLTSGPVQGSFTQSLDWLDTAGAVVLTEQRTVTVYHTSDDERLLDAALSFQASAGAVIFGDTKEGGLISVRVATSMDAKEAGRIENAAGGIQEAETWGKRAQWCDYSGPVTGHTLGVCLMDHPDNPRHPTHWHVRNYGLMTANPFGLRDYTRDPAQRGDLLLQNSARLTFRYRVLIHRGNAQDADLHARYQDLAHPPAVTVETG